LERLRHSPNEIAENRGGDDLPSLIGHDQPVAVAEDHPFDPPIDVLDRTALGSSARKLYTSQLFQISEVVTQIRNRFASMPGECGWADIAVAENPK
jgi:hypothetical protein